MALDPLKFAIAIEKRQLKAQIEEARRDIERGLTNVPITVRIANLDKLQEQLNGLKLTLNVSGGSSSGASAKDLEELRKELDLLRKAYDELLKTTSKSKGDKLDAAVVNAKKNYETLDVAIKNTLHAITSLNKQIDLGKSFGVGTKSAEIELARLRDTLTQLAQLRNDPGLVRKDFFTTPESLGGFAHLWKNYQQMMKEAATAGSSLEADVARVQQLNMAMEKLTAAHSKLDAARQKGGLLGANTDKAVETMIKIEELQEKFRNVNQKDANAVQVLIDAYRKLGIEIGQTLSIQKQLNQEEQKKKSQAASEATKRASDAKQIAEQARQAQSELVRLDILLRDMKSQSKKAKLLDIDTTEIDGTINRLKALRDILKNVADGSLKTSSLKGVLGGDYFADKIIGADQIKQLIKAIDELEKKQREEARAAKEAETAAQRKAKADQELTLEEQRLARAIQQASNEASKQSQVLSDLKSMAMQYLSVYAGQQFLSNIIEIGGQLEMQRLSIGAILQDTAHATDLFDKIKNLALQSPFGVVELDQYTKQLSAYGFKYNELFDMTKRLADISAGAGTDVSRLALALGHVRSEGALTGYTLRQFAMNNIPMVGKLAEKLSELEGRIVSVSEVRKRVSKKEIDYGMVEDVIKDLTNEGGMFYNMQEVISGSVKAKWKNLRDAFDIMYGEMAESAVGGALKGTATILTKLAKQWKTIGTVVGAVAAVYGTAKVSMLAYNTLLGQQTRVVLGTIAAERQAEISRLRLAQSYRILSASEKAVLASNAALRASDIKAALSSKQLSIEQLSKAVAMGKVSKATALAGIQTAKMTYLEREQAIATIQNTRVLGLWGKAMYGLRVAVLGLGAALKTLLLNPMTWITAAVAGMTYLWQKNKEEMERAQEIANNLAERSSEGLKNVRTMMSETEMTYTKNGKAADVATTKGGTFSYKPASEMDSAGMMQVMDKWTDFINSYAATPNAMLNEAWRDGEGNVRTISDQYEHLAQSVKVVSEAQRELAKVSEAVNYALGETDKGWLDDDFITNINDYSRKAKSFGETLTKTVHAYPKVVSAALKAAKADQKFAKAIDDANEVMMEKEGRNLTEFETMKRLVEGQDDYNEALKKFKEAANTASGMEDFYGDTGVGNSYRFMKNAEGTMDKDMDTFVKNFKDYISDAGYDLNNLTEAQKQAILIAIGDVVAKAGDATEEIRKQRIKLLAEKFGIKVDIDTVEAVERVSALKEDLNNLVNGEWVIDLKTVTNFSDLITKIRQEYKSAQDYFNNVKPMMINSGVNVSGGMKRLTDEQKKMIILNWKKQNPNGNLETVYMMIDQWNSLADAMSNALDFSKATNISLTDPNPGGKVLKDKKGKTKKDKKETDTQAKEWKERIRQLKDARQWYDKWEKEIGKTSALEKVQEIFHGLIRKEDINTLEAYEKALKAVKAQAESRKAKNKGKDEKADEVIRQADDELAQLDMLKFQRDSDIAVSMMKKGIEDLTRRWEIFNDVLSATGDRTKAMDLAGFDDFDRAFNTSSPADALLNHIGSDIMLPDLANMIDWNKIMNMSDKGIEDYVKDWLGGSKEYSRYIKSITDGLIEWKKLQKDYVKQSISDYAKLIGSTQDYLSLIQKNNSEFDETRKKLNTLLELGMTGQPGGISKAEYDKAIELARVMRDDKNAKLSSAYLNLMNRANALTRGEMLDAVDNAIMHLNEQLKVGAISLETYTNEMAKLRKITHDWKDNAFFGKNNAITNFLQGGMTGLGQYFSDKADNLRNSGDSTGAAEYEKYLDNLKGVYSALGDLALVVELVTGALDGMQKAATALSEMFQALGSQGSANRWSDIASGIGAVSSIFNPASSAIQSAMNGNVGGAISSAISAPFEMIASPIKGFAELHDRKRERAIEKIRQEVQRISNTLSLIQTGRGRTLGYDDGRYRQMFASLYANAQSASGKGMYEYYTRGGTSGNGYMQEIEAMKQQREDYLKMYDKEKSKKNESTEALEEYKVKMAELDDKIMYYTEDLANELWSIDLKGWADQIGDALMTAFENGTSAALAFKDATQDILRSVVNEMLKVGIIQPMMDKLRERLFGENGAFDYNDPQGSMGQVLAELGKFFGKGGEGEAMMTAGKEFLVGAEELLNTNFGMSMKSSSQSTQTNGIQSQATEESIGIVSGQLARIAQDVSVKRIFVTQFVTDQMPKLLESAQMQSTILENQFQSVRAIEHMMSDGSGAMFESIDRMSRKLDRAITADGKVRIQ